MPPHADTDASALLTSCVPPALRAQNFAHLTQAATGATSGDWLVKFCKSSVSRCSRVESTWAKLSAQLAASRDAKGMPRVNVASVDTTDSGWLTKRLGRSRRPPWRRPTQAPVPPSDLAAPGAPTPTGRYRSTGCPVTASGARASRPRSRRFRRLFDTQALRHHLGAGGAALQGRRDVLVPRRRLLGRPPHAVRRARLRALLAHARPP